MKRFVLGKLFIISAALIVLSFISCNQNLKEENGMGKVVISLGNTARSLDDEGLPVLNDKNTVIMITDDSQPHPHPKQYKGSRVSVEFPIGTEITVTVIVSTPAGVQWRGEKTLTVAAGVNNVSLELSKTPSYVPGVGFSLNGEQLSIGIGSTTPPDLTVSKDFTPKIKLDGIGRVYVLYKAKDDSKKYLTRYTVEGEADTVFNEAISKLSRNNQDFMNNIENIAADTETGNIFLIEKEGILPAGFRIYCIIKEAEKKEAEKFKCYSGNLSGVKVKAAAAYNGTLFLAGIKDNDTKLLAYTTELQTVGERNDLILTPAGETVIATISPENNGTTDCNDIYADGTGVYVLLSSTSLKGNIYSVGQINRYEYDGGNFEGKAEVGCVGKGELKNGGIAFDDNFFSKPVAFTGWDNDKLYIADDGINIVYEKASEIFRVDGNKNRVAMFCKNKRPNQQQLTFYPSVPWYEEYPKYTPPNTPVLSWEKDFNTPAQFYGMKYWTTSNVDETAFSEDNKLWASTDPSIKPTDIFCYDQDGNLYIVYIKDNDKMVRRFELKYDGKKFFYAKDSVQYAKLNISNEPTAIAVDISNGKNCLYYAYEISSENKCFIKKYEPGNNPSEVTKIENATITALAANKDGLFAAIKEEDTDNKKYSLAVKKYGETTDTIDVIKDAIINGEVKDNYYNEYTGAINALQIKSGNLYGVMSTEERIRKEGEPNTMYGFKNSSVLYDFGETKGFLSKSELINKNYDNSKHIGYGFYRFIGVQKDKLFIASDGAWAGKVNGTMKAFNNNKVFTCNFNSEGSISSISQTDDLTTVKYTIQRITQ